MPHEIVHTGGITTPMRLWAVVYEWRGLEKKIIRRAEVTIKDGKFSLVDKDGTATDVRGR